MISKRARRSKGIYWKLSKFIVMKRMTVMSSMMLMTRNQKKLDPEKYKATQVKILLKNFKISSNNERCKLNREAK